MGRPWGQTVFKERVTSVILTWWDGGPSLEVSTEAAVQPCYITFRGGRAKLWPR